MGTRTEKWYGQKINEYFQKHYGEHEGVTEWFVNLMTNRWKCYIPGLELVILFTCGDKGEKGVKNVKSIYKYG